MHQSLCENSGDMETAGSLTRAGNPFPATRRLKKSRLGNRLREWVPAVQRAVPVFAQTHQRGA
jgi:hypothetical protein